MKKTMVIFLLSFAGAWAQSAAAELDEVVQAESASLEALYKHLHAHPELSFHEQETSARIARELETAGFQVTTHVGGYGVVGVMKNGPGKTVLVRTDLDALPITEKTGLPYASKVRVKDDAGNEVGVMHACGHDMHMSCFVGTARVLAKLKDRWKGTLVMIGQPAEERGSGSRAMLADGLFTRFPRPDYCLALHVNSDMKAGTVGYVPGYALASVDSVDITIRGIGGHGSRPETAKDPIVIAAQVINGLQTIVSREVSPLDSAVVTVGSIHGGTKHNIRRHQADHGEHRPRGRRPAGARTHRQGIPHRNHALGLQRPGAGPAPRNRLETGSWRRQCHPAAAGDGRGRFLPVRPDEPQGSDLPLLARRHRRRTDRRGKAVRRKPALASLAAVLARDSSDY